MNEFYTWFAGLDSFIEFCIVWLAGCTVGVIGKTVFRIVNRILRTIRIWHNGWPPAHLDADGDWKPLPKTD